MRTGSIAELLTQRDVSDGFVHWARDNAEDLMQVWHACYRADWLMELLVHSNAEQTVVVAAAGALDGAIAELAPGIEPGCAKALRAAYARKDPRACLPEIAVLLGDAAEQDPTYRENPYPKVRPSTTEREPRTLMEAMATGALPHRSTIDSQVCKELYYKEAQHRYADALRAAVPWEDVRVALGDTSPPPYR